MPCNAADQGKQGKIEKSDAIEDALDTEYVLVEHGLESLDTQVHSISLFLNQTEGRDKLVKLTQSVAHLISHYVPTWERPMSILEKSCSTTRKNLRLGTALPFMRMAWRIYNTPSHTPTLKMAVLGRFIGLSGYFWSDNLGWLIQNEIISGVHKNTPKKMSVMWMLFSLFNTIFLLFHQLHEVFRKIRNTKAAISALQKKEDSEFVDSDEDDDFMGHSRMELRLWGRLSVLKTQVETLRDHLTKLRRKRFLIYIEVFKNSIDLITACNFLFDLRLNPVVIDMLEVSVSAMSIHRMIRVFARKIDAEKELKRTSLKHLKNDSLVHMYGLGSKDKDDHSA